MRRPQKSARDHLKSDRGPFKMKPHPEVQLTLIADFAAEIIKQDDLDDILWLIIDRIIKALDFEDCVI